MAPIAKFYDPDDVMIYIGGQLLQGYADGEFASIENVSKMFESVAGTDGEVARSPSNDFRVKVKIKLLQTSSSNAALSAMLTKDLKTKGGGGVVTFELQDLVGGSSVKGDQAWLTGWPEATYDRTAKSREWEVEIAVGRRQEQGN